MWPHGTDTTDWVSDRGVRNVFFYFGSVFKKTSDLVRNKFGLVRLKKCGLVGYYSYLLLM